MCDEKESISIIVAEEAEDPGVDYAAEYLKQTGRDFETGEYVTQ